MEINRDRTSGEPQYDDAFQTFKELGPVSVGPMASHLWRSDPRHLGFFLARYKICAKLLTGKKCALEAGCGDGFGMRVVLQEVESVVGVDFDPLFIDWASKHAAHEKLNCSFQQVDLIQNPPAGSFDAAYSLDVIEHIAPDQERAFLDNICRALQPGAVLVIGTPNLTSQQYASKWSKAGHINCKTAEMLRSLMGDRFHNVFVFSMNDEMLHLGYYPMAHYLFGVYAGFRG